MKIPHIATHNKTLAWTILAVGMVVLPCAVSLANSSTRGPDMATFEMHLVAPSTSNPEPNAAGAAETQSTGAKKWYPVAEAVQQAVVKEADVSKRFLQDGSLELLLLVSPDDITGADVGELRSDLDQFGSPSVIADVREGARDRLRRMTEEHVGSFVAQVLNGKVTGIFHIQAAVFGQFVVATGPPPHEVANESTTVLPVKSARESRLRRLLPLAVLLLFLSALAAAVLRTLRRRAWTSRAIACVFASVLCGTLIGAVLLGVSHRRTVGPGTQPMRVVVHDRSGNVSFSGPLGVPIETRISVRIDALGAAFGGGIGAVVALSVALAGMVVLNRVGSTRHL